MKLVLTIVSNRDLSKVLAAASAEGFFSTKVSTAGQFLEGGHTTILFGVDDEKVDFLFNVLESNVTKRVIRKSGVESTIEGSLLKKPVDVEEYGAVAFVIDVEQFKRL
ncbi:MAG: cyclic-di-AMP receptor [Eubacterium sp.]|nr:cyclic-di-AMP receptor [Eubacterium sp.]